MHFEFLVEGQSERTALEPLLTKILGDYGNPHTWKIHKHRGRGKIPVNPATKPSPTNATLLHNLPAKLRAYGKTQSDNEVLVVLLDLDETADCIAFKKSLVALKNRCNPSPKTLFRIAIEELEAWYFGDRQALMQAYPQAKKAVLDSYVQDSICGTWEMLADAVYPGGSSALKRAGHRTCLGQKRIWARDITAHMDVAVNKSTSFRSFRDGLRDAARTTEGDGSC